MRKREIKKELKTQKRVLEKAQSALERQGNKESPVTRYYLNKIQSAENKISDMKKR